MGSHVKKLTGVRVPHDYRGSVMTGHADLDQGRAEALAFFRAMLLACSAGVIGWIILGAIAFGIYELVN